MKNQEFLSPMKKYEALIGWIYLPIHIVALPYLIAYLSAVLFPEMGITLDAVYQNALYYGFSFLFLLLFLNRFLCISFSDLCDNAVNTVIAVIAGYFVYYFLSYAVQSLLSLVLSDLVNPNSALVDEEIRRNTGAMAAVAVLLAPIAEETLFRGVVFGTLRKKSRFLAYAASALLFSLYHLWQFLLPGSFEWTTLLYLLQYLPPAIALCWCYERGRSLWAPIFLHMAINLISVIASLSA